LKDVWTSFPSGTIELKWPIKKKFSELYVSSFYITSLSLHYKKERKKEKKKQKKNTLQERTTSAWSTSGRVLVSLPYSDRGLWRNLLVRTLNVCNFFNTQAEDRKLMKNYNFL